MVKSAEKNVTACILTLSLINIHRQFRGSWHACKQLSHIGYQHILNLRVSRENSLESACESKEGGHRTLRFKFSKHSETTRGRLVIPTSLNMDMTCGAPKNLEYRRNTLA